VDQGGIPAERPQASPTRARTTTHSERGTTTLRHRLSRLVRDTFACAKKVEHHSGAVKFFLCHSNLGKAAALPV
jgi:insertion element IS1 protein InsB